jgi:large subunit ribosomal protein L16
MMVKNISSNLKKRPFKIWTRNKRFVVRYNGLAKYVPVSLPTLSNLAHTSNYISAIRFRRIVVRSTQYGYLSSNAIEAFRKVLAPHFRKKSSKIYKFFIRCYSYLPLTKKPSEVRIGGGKGSKIRGFYSPVRPGQILFEVLVRNPTTTTSLLLYASRKLSVSVKVVKV